MEKSQYKQDESAFTPASLPAAFLSRMQQMLGEEYEDFLASYQRPRAQALRVNTLKISVNDFLKRSPFSLEPVPWCSTGFYYSGTDRTDADRKDQKMGETGIIRGEIPDALKNPDVGDSADDEAVRSVRQNQTSGHGLRPGRHPFHEAGMYYIQEPSAMSVAALSGTRPGERVLDLCAAPGGKSTQLAAMLQGRGLLVSNEINADRANILSQNIERMGVRNAVVLNCRPEELSRRFPVFFDRVIVDAPCSGEGMFRKEEQAITMWSEENVRNCAARQQEILEEAAKMVRSGGFLEYSTCTFAPEEDEGTVGTFLERHPEYHLVDLPAQLGDRMKACGFEAGRPEWAVRSKGESALAGTIRLFPHKLRGEGHFAALMQREGSSVERKASQVREIQIPREFNEFANATLTVNILQERAEASRSILMRQKDTLWLVPENLSLSGLRCLRPGLELGTLRKNRFEPAHALAMALRPEEVKNCCNIDWKSHEAAAWFRGESLPCDPSLKGWILVTINGCSAGWGKASGGMIKNHYPKGLRRAL